MFPCLPSLLDLCSIRLAYLLCIRRLSTNYNQTVDDFFNENEISALAAAQELRLPENNLQTLLMEHVKPTGGRLFSLLKLWLSKLPRDTPQKHLIGNMLFDCLVLTAHGLINERKTAQTLLSNKILHHELAFRLACINFLETEVLKLWTIVREYFLNKIEDEGRKAYLPVYQLHQARLGSEPFPEEDLEDIEVNGEEHENVLFWIAYCLSREKAVDIEEVPHYRGTDEREEGEGWYAYALSGAVFSGNVACLEYFKSFRDESFEYDNVNTINTILSESNWCQHASFIFHFMLLNLEEKFEFFRKCPLKMVNQFLQWPLSQTFLQNTEKIWNLIPDTHKHLVFRVVCKTLVFENVLLCKNAHFTNHNLTYCVQHLIRIWHALWKVSPDNYKSAFLDLCVFPDFEDFNGDESPSRFVTSGLKQKLLSLFLTNGGSVLDLFRKETLQESLRSVVYKYMPEESQDLERRYLSFFEAITIPLRRFEKKRGRGRFARDEMKSFSSFSGKYLYYIKDFLFSLDRESQTFFH